MARARTTIYWARPLLLNSTGLAIGKSWLEELWRDLHALLRQSPQLATRERRLLERELVVVLVGDTKARRLNYEYRGRDYATDILSFAGDGETLGELVFCSSKVRSQARRNHHSVKAEFAYLLIHGVLHLLGFEHEGESPPARRKAKRMLDFQDVLFDRIREKYDL